MPSDCLKRFNNTALPAAMRWLPAIFQPLRQAYPPMRPTPESLNELPGRGPAPKVKRANQKALSARRVAWLILQRPETLDNEQEQLIEKTGGAA